MRELESRTGHVKSKYKKDKKRKQKLNENNRIITNVEEEEPTSIFKKRRRFRLNDNFLVSREESEKRLQIGCFGSAFPLTILCTALTLVYCQSLVVNVPIILLPNKTTVQNPLDGYPMPHIAVIYQDGSVFDISLQENFSPSKNLLIKLPDDTNDKDDRGKRYAYQDQIGTLYFFSSTISRPVTQLQQKSRFHTITHNGQKLFDLDRRVKLYSGTQLGNKFWVWGSAYHGGEQNTGWDLMGWQFHDLLYKDSYIWHTKRQRWSKGPHLFESIREPWASTGINATAAILIAYPAPARAYVYDFETNQMVEYPYLPESILNVPYHFAAVFSLATLINKTQRKAYCECLMENVNNGQNGIKALISYDLDEGIYGEWVVESIDYYETQSYASRYLVLTVARGLLYSFNNIHPNKALGSVYQNGTWQELNTTYAPGNHWPVFATPYFVRV